MEEKPKRITNILFKPLIGCLTTHMAAWNFLGVGTDSQRDVYECTHCRTNFFYPTKQMEYPIYRKFRHR